MNRDMSTNEVFQLRLEKTYYERGFFNVTRDFDHFVRSDDGPCISPRRSPTARAADHPSAGNCRHLLERCDVGSISSRRVM